MRTTPTVVRLIVTTLAIGVMIVPASPTAASASARNKARSPNNVAEWNLRNGIVAGLVFYTADDTFTGFDSAEATLVEPSLTWADGDAVAENVVNIAGIAASGQRLMVETLSSSGTSFCIARAEDKGDHHLTVYGMDTSGGAFHGYRGCKNAPSGSW